MPRLFFGVPIPSEVREELEKQIRGGASDEGALPLSFSGVERVSTIPGRVVPPENWHLTLLFLGEVIEAEFERVADAGYAIASRFGAFEIVLAGAGAFPGARRARVTWIGVAEGAEELRAIHEALRDPTPSHSSHSDKFHPHLTLSRLKIMKNVSTWVEQHRDVRVQFRADRFCLFQSHLERSGAKYEVLREYPFAG